MKVFFALFCFFAAVLAVPTSLEDTSPLNTTTTASLARRWSHGGCSFHVTITEYCDYRKYGGYQLFTNINIPYIRDGEGHYIGDLTWGEPWKKTPEPIDRAPHFLPLNVYKSQIWGLETTLQVEWKPDTKQGNVEYQYKDCAWSANDYYGSGKCANCGRGLWTSGDSPAQTKPGSNKGCDETRKSRTQDMDCFFPC